jgi:hypothetical protein
VNAVAEAIPVQQVEDAEAQEWLEQNGLLCEPADRTGLDIHIDQLLERIGELRAEVAHVEDVAARRAAMIDRWRDDEVTRLERQARYLEERIRLHAVAYTFEKGKKSRALPHGQFGFQKVRMKVVVKDKAAALAFAKLEEIPVKVEESVLLTPLKEYVESTGLEPAGCEVVPEHDAFYVRVGG